MRHFGRAQRMQPQRRVARFQPAEQPFVEVDFQSGVQAALQQQLVAAQTERAVDFSQYCSIVVMNARSVWWGLQWKLQNLQPEMQTLVMLTLRSICHVTT